jgi:hypothetical protein
MQDLEGNLQVFEPICVLQLLNLATVTGELRVEAKSNSASIYFERGNVTFAGITNRPVRLGEFLLKDKLISKKLLNSILKKKDKGKKLGTLLTEAGIITETELRRAVEEQIKEVIYEVVSWQDGRFVFIDGKRPHTQDILIDIPLDHLILEGLKRLDEERDKI